MKNKLFLVVLLSVLFIGTIFSQNDVNVTQLTSSDFFGSKNDDLSIKNDIVTKKDNIQLSFVSKTSKASNIQKTVNITAGNLSASLTSDELTTVSDLIITGTMDARDFKTIRDKMTAMMTLDLSGVNITAYSGAEGTDTVGKIKNYEENAIPQFALWNSETKIVNNLNTIILPPNITLIKKNSLMAQSFSTINIPASVKTIDAASFYSCKNLTSLSITGNGETTIATNAFRLCSALTNVSIGSGVKSMGDRVFQDCSKLTSISISSGLETIGNWSFWNCAALASITVDEGNQNFSSLDGVLFNKDKTTLVQFPQAKQTTYSIPLGVTTIRTGAFGSVNKLTSVIIPESVITIGDWAFEACSSLASVTFGSNVTSIGNGAFFQCAKLSAIDLPTNLKTIGNDAFNGCSSLSSVTIPNNVTSVGLWAFNSCTKLTTVNFNAKNCTSIGSNTYPAFNNCTAFVILNVGDDVEIIASNSFKNCIYLTSVTIGKNVKSIGDYAFSNSTNLTTVNFNAINCTTMGSKTYPVFYNCSSFTTLNMGLEVNNVPDYGFYGCNNLSSPNIGENVNRIGKYAFSFCYKLTSVIIPNNVKVIDDYAFANTSIYPVIIGNNVTDIGEGAFSENSKLQSITFPNSLISIGAFAFSACDTLQSVAIPKNVTYIGGMAFSNCINLATINVDEENSTYSSTDGVLYDKSRTVLIQCPPAGRTGEFVIPSSVSELGYGAFIFCSGFTKINIHSNVNKIGDLAFASCTNLAALDIPNGVTRIGMGTFAYCLGLKSISLPNNLTTIDKQAFYECTSLMELVNHTPVPPTIGTDIFLNVPTSTCVLKVPLTSIDAYKSADQWKDFANIVGIDTSPVKYISENETSVKITNEGVIITSCNPKDKVQIFGINGQELYSSFINNGNVNFLLKKGVVYILKTPNKTFKLIR